MTIDPAAQGWTIWQTVGFTELAGPLWSRRDRESHAYAFLVEDKHLNRGGIVHGGMLATFADIVMGRAAYDRVKPRTCATIQLNMHYISAANGGDFVEGRAEVIRVTRSLVFVHGRCLVAGNTVAMTDGIWKILGESRKF